MGNLRPEVLKLRDHYHLPGMKVLQFTFNPQTPYANDVENVVAYTGTHDNQPLVSWFSSQSSSFRRRTKVFLDTSGYHYENVIDNLIAFLMNSKANMVIIPMQDILHLNAKSRMNTPGTLIDTNWTWKLADFKDFEKKLDRFSEMIQISQR